MDKRTNRPDSPVVEMSGISKYFPGVTANEQIDLSLYPGEVLALLGENGAGKSTLMNILVGLYRQDEGEIYVRGNHVDINSPRDADKLGIGMVHQNFMLVDSMTVTENIILGMQEIDFVPNIENISREVLELSRRYNLEVDPRAYIRQLSVGEQQRVEILKALYRGDDILILDEPTAVLTPQESARLNEIVQRMTREGKSAIFITHKMEEVIRFSHRVMVLRQGRQIAVKNTSETTPQELANLMVGREVLFNIEKKPARPGETVLELENVHVIGEKGVPALNGIDLTVRSGEIVGIAGVAGNGQRELAGAVTGLNRVAEGRVRINGTDMTNKPVLEIIKNGVSYIPDDRIALGVVGDMSVSSNLSLKGYRKPPYYERGMLRLKRIGDFAAKMIDAFRISTPTPETLVKFLSGGNIQKTILAREIDACGGVLVASYPSRGLDVGAIESVRNMLIEQRDCGNGVLLISEELDELLSVADRIAVLYEGKIMGIVPVENAHAEMLGLMMTGVPYEKAAGKPAE